MKVLFLHNLEHNKVGDIKDVPAGYARNYLLKNNLAVVASEENIANLQGKINKLKAEEEKTITALEVQKEKIEALKLEISAQAGDEDKLFGAITNRDIADALAKHKVSIDKHNIEIINPIHELGDHDATVKLGHGIHATVKIVVVRSA